MIETERERQVQGRCKVDMHAVVEDRDDAREGDRERRWVEGKSWTKAV